MSLSFAIQMHDERWTALACARDEHIKAILTDAIEVAGPDKDPGELCLVFSNDQEVQGLNREWRDKDRPTNVLSFPAEEESFPGDDPVLGDVVLAFETIEREAREQGKPFENHCTHLLVHGFLHLLGYDHQNEEEAGQMEALERKILSNQGLDDPYA